MVDPLTFAAFAPAALVLNLASGTHRVLGVGPGLKRGSRALINSFSLASDVSLWVGACFPEFGKTAVGKRQHHVNYTTAGVLSEPSV